MPEVAAATFDNMNLLRAVHTDSLEKIMQIVLSNGIPIDSKCLDYAVLNCAIECGRIDVAKFLLERNCRVNSSKKLDRSSNTPLHNAIELCDLELVQMLLDRNASITATDAEDNTPLHLAFIRRQDKIVDVILSRVHKTVNYTNPKNNHGLTHMHIACTRYNGQIVQNYLDSKVDIADAVRKDSPLWPGFTALHFAVEFGSLEALTILKKASSYNYPKDSEGQTALQLASQKVKVLSTMVHILSTENMCIEDGQQNHLTYFHMACLRDDPGIIKAFMNNGSDVNLSVSREAVFCPLYTPLHFAVESNCKANVELLLNNGAYADSQNGYYMTPLHIALYNENHRKKNTIVDILYKYTVDKDADCTDLNGLSYFHVAITRNELRLVKKLLDKNEDVNGHILYNLRNFSHYTPLHFAVRYQHFEMVDLLIKYGANVNRSDMGMDGTPLHLAFQTGNKAIIELLLKKRARVNAIRPYDEKSMLHLLIEHLINRKKDAYENDPLAMYIERLVKLGCDVNARDTDGNTALHLVCSKISKGSTYVKILLELGADINLVNVEDQTPFELSFYEDCSNKNGEYMMLYEHSQKLKAIDVKLNTRNNNCCQRLVKDYKTGKVEGFSIEILAKMHQQRLDEIDKLKSVRLARHVTLLDFLTMDTKKLLIYVEAANVRKIAEHRYLKKKFPIYGYLIKLQYDKGLDNLVVNDRRKRSMSDESERDTRSKRRRF